MYVRRSRTARSQALFPTTESARRLGRVRDRAIPVPPLDTESEEQHGVSRASCVHVAHTSRASRRSSRRSLVSTGRLESAHESRWILTVGSLLAAVTRLFQVGHRGGSSARLYIVYDGRLRRTNEARSRCIVLRIVRSMSRASQITRREGTGPTGDARYIDSGVQK